MTTDTVFADQAPAATSASGTTDQVADVAPSLTLVGDGRKYKSVEELEKAYINADDFIERLKQENEELRRKTTAAKTIDEVLDRSNQQQHEVKADQPAPSVDIAKLVEKTVEEREAKKVRENNILKADKMLKETFGDKATEVYKAKAATPELHRVYMELAATSPEQFAAIFNAKPATAATAVDSGGSFNNSVSYSSGNREGTPGTKEFYNKVRKSDPTTYYSNEFQLKMQKAAQANPKLYFGE
jgi:hypothetical protein